MFSLSSCLLSSGPSLSPCGDGRKGIQADE
jgi:hypothetical protein